MLCNLLTTILKPNFEDPLDTAKQLVEKNITIYFWPYTEGNDEWFMKSTIPEYKILGEHAIHADDWLHFDENLTADALGAGTNALVSYQIDYYLLKMGETHHPEGRGWHRSKERVSGLTPYSGYHTNKKWYFKEVLL